ncbi:MAG TPA: hypothetical protein PKE51_01510 [Gemmatimonadaceae bacterium]|nr:hypothetical protein [Gemmatimonadaceae bacterium]
MPASASFRRSIAAALVLASLVSGCVGEVAPVAPDASPTAPTPPALRINNDAAALDARVRAVDADLGTLRAPAAGPEVGDSVAASQTEELVRFAEEGQVEAPVSEVGALQATHSAFVDGFAYVSYAMVGEPAAGAVDVFDVRGNSTPRLISSATLQGSDVHTLAVSGDRLYLGTGAQDRDRGETAVLEVLEVANGRIVQRVARLILPSHVVTGIAIAAGKVWVTTGTGSDREGGLTVLDERTLERLSFDEFSDARAVAPNGSSVIAVVRGRPGRVRMYDQQSGAFLREFDVGGLSFANAKASIVSRATWAYVGAADGGVVLVQLRQNGRTTGTVAGRLARPVVSGLRDEYAVTNAVTTAGDFVVSADGAAGVSIAHTTDQWTAQTSRPSLTPIGRLALPDGFSANFVAGSYPNLFVAAGYGGLRLVRIRVAGNGNGNGNGN